MKTIFDNQDAIQVNKPWEYNESDHKWTIDENDVIEHVELSQEIYNDFHKLDQYNLVLEEAYDVYDRLVNQVIENNNILKNTRVSLENVSLSNECLSISKTLLGYDVTINRSNESDMTNYERLVLSNEGIKEFLKDIWEKIKAIFKKVYDFIKGIIVKLLKWLGFYKDNLDTMEKTIKENISKKVSNESVFDNYGNDIHELAIKINNILTGEKININPDTFAKIIMEFPILVFNVPNLKSFSDLLDLINPGDIIKQFTSSYKDYIKTITEGKELSFMQGRRHVGKATEALLWEIDKYLESVNGEDIYRVALMTNLYVHGNDLFAKCLLLESETVAITDYKTLNLTELAINISQRKNVEDVGIIAKDVYSKYTLDKLFSTLHNDIIKNLNEYENNIKKIQSEILNNLNKINYVNLDDDDKYKYERIKKFKSLLKDIGAELPLDILKYTHSTMKSLIKVITYLYNDLKTEAEDIYKKHVVELNEKYNSKLELKYLNNNKDYPYFEYSKGDLTGPANCIPFTSKGGVENFYIALEKEFVNSKTYQIQSEKVTSVMDKKHIDDALSSFGIQPIGEYDYSNITSPDGYLSLLAHTLTSNDTAIDILKRNVRYNGYMSTELKQRIREVSKKLTKSLSPEDIRLLLTITLRRPLINYIMSKSESGIKEITYTRKEIMAAYFHEMGHAILRQKELQKEYGYFSHQHMELPFEIQADCYSMIRAGMSIEEMVILRADKMCLMEGLVPNMQMRLNYAAKLEEFIPTVLKWTGMSKIEHYKQTLKRNNKFETLYKVYKSL